MTLAPFADADLARLAPLRAASEAEGFRFLRRFESDWLEGHNRFDRVGETFLAVAADDRLLAVGGLNLHEPGVGRLRRFYVHPGHRRAGVGRRLLDALITHARPHFSSLVLHTETEAADAFYRASGFVRIPDSADPTHRLVLTPRPQP